MSQNKFQDTFTKHEDSKDLQYDQFGFYFFATTMLSIIILFLAYHIYSVYKKMKTINPKKLSTCECYFCQKKINLIKKRRKFSFFLIFKIVLLFFLMFLFVQSIKKCKQSQGLKSFDPYEILDVEIGSSDKTIKKAFRSLARKFHPDKNPGDPDSHKKFILINKAYQCLQNEEARKNCMDFGNPEGNKGSYQVGIALPPFLLKQENKFVVLSLFFIFVLIVLPFSVMYLYQTSETIDAFGTKKSLHYLALQYFKNENILFKNFLEIISLTEEMQPILSVKPSQIKDLQSLVDNEVVPKMGLKNFKPFLKPFYLLNAYMNQETIPKSLEEDMIYVLKKSIHILNSLITITIELYSMDPRLIIRLLNKPLNFEIIHRLISFTQHFYQGISLHSSSILQLPGINKQNIEKFKKKLKKNSEINKILNNEEKQELLFSFFKNNDEIQKEIKKTLQTLPNRTLEIKSIVKLDDDKEDEEIFAGDVFTLQMKINCTNKKLGYIHSKNFPFLKSETLFLIIKHKKSERIEFYKKIVVDKLNIVEEFSSYTQQSGKIEYEILIRSDSYVGMDLSQDYVLEVKPKIVTEEKFIIHPDDEKALKEESLFKTMMNELQNDMESEDEEEEQEEEINLQKIKETIMNDEIKEEKDQIQLLQFIDKLNYLKFI